MTFQILIPNNIDKDKLKNIKKNLFINDNTDTYVIAKLITNSSYGIINLILVIPEFHQIEIQNCINYPITYKQVNCEKELIIQPNKTTYFTWENCWMEKKELQLTIENQTVNVSFDDYQFLIIYLKEVIVYVVLLVTNSNLTKVLRIYDEKEEDGSENKLIKQVMINKKSGYLSTIRLNLKGLGISLIDSFPREIFYISFYRVKLVLINNFFRGKFINQQITSLLIKIMNIQIDYCLDDSFLAIFYPKIQYLPSNGKLKAKDKDRSPFMKLLISRELSEDKKTSITSTKYSRIEFSMEPTNLKIDQCVFKSFLQILNSINEELNFYYIKKETIFEDSGDEFDPSKFDKMLNCSLDFNEEIDKVTDEYNMILVDYLSISALKFLITLRIDISSIDISNVPNILTKIIGTIGNVIARITDSHLSFKAIEKYHLFNDVNRIKKTLIENYTKQTIIQIYKFLGSSDLVGNPIGLINNVEKGVYNFVEEPVKYIKKGPGELGIGMAKGMNSLVSGVVGGTFDSVSKISGSLLSGTK